MQPRLFDLPLVRPAFFNPSEGAGGQPAGNDLWADPVHCFALLSEQVHGPYFGFFRASYVAHSGDSYVAYCKVSREAPGSVWESDAVRKLAVESAHSPERALAEVLAASEELIDRWIERAVLLPEPDSDDLVVDILIDPAPWPRLAHRLDIEI